ncbi:MAG: response regulator transcription factor [Cyclobacteriaceae bacterium]|nr:response regulator transcription factor [Cyclobacteriaceae bacterium]
MKIRIAIVDDKQVNRVTIREKLAGEAMLEVVSDSANGDDFLLLMKSMSPDKRPHVVLMDLEMPVLNGIQTIAVASAAYPEVKFVVLTVFEDNDKIFDAIKAGAHGYLLKDESASKIIDAINQVVQFEGMPLSPVIARKVIEMLKHGSGEHRSESRTPDTGVVLSDRELDILKELATGKSYKAIGETLFISPFTVRKHVSNIYTKLHVDSRVQVINVAQKNKWV